MGVVNVKLKSQFFDRQGVIDAVGKVAAAAMAKGGALIRTTAQRSMRRRKSRIPSPQGGTMFRPSPAGTPPFSHAGQLRDLLYFTFDSATKSTVVGPVPFKKGEAPRLNEFGGHANREFRKIRTVQGKKQLVSKSVVASYPRRPFMGPALVKVQPKMADFFKGQLKG